MTSKKQKPVDALGEFRRKIDYRSWKSQLVGVEQQEERVLVDDSDVSRNDFQFDHGHDKQTTPISTLTVRILNHEKTHNHVSARTQKSHRTRGSRASSGGGGARSSRRRFRRASRTRFIRDRVSVSSSNHVCGYLQTEQDESAAALLIASFNPTPYHSLLCWAYGLIFLQTLRIPNFLR